MKNLEHTIRNVVSDNHIVEQELIEAKAIIEDFQKEFLLMVIEEYDEITEEEYNIITEELLQNLNEEDYSGLKSFIPGYDVYKSLKKGKYSDAAKEAGIDVLTTALGLTGVGAPAAAAIRGARALSKMSKIKALRSAGKKLPASPKMSLAKRYMKNLNLLLKQQQ